MKEKQLQATNDRVIVKPVELEETYGNIVVPDLGKDRPEVGEVISIGPGRVTEFGTKVEVNCKIGDIILVPKIGSIRVEYKGEEYYIVQDREILAKVV